MMTVLVASGDCTEARAIVEALARLDGIAVQGAVRDRDSAVRAATEIPLDIIVTSTSLADGEALKLVEDLRRDERGSAIVVVGRDATRDDWRRHLAAGADRFVEPDPDLVELREVVLALARRGRGRDASQARRRDAAQQDAIDRAMRVAATVRDCVVGAPTATELDLGELVNRVVKVARYAFSSRIEIALDISSDVRPVHGVVYELEELVFNLVTFASRSLARGETLTVRVAPTASAAALLEVITPAGDNGISDAVVELALARVLVQRHQATMTIIPKAPTGSAIRVMLPLSLRRGVHAPHANVDPDD